MLSPQTITLQGKTLEEVKREMETAYRKLRADIAAITGPTGTFTTADTPAKTVTVTGGIITALS